MQKGIWEDRRDSTAHRRFNWDHCQAGCPVGANRAQRLGPSCFHQQEILFRPWMLGVLLCWLADYWNVLKVRKTILLGHDLLVSPCFRKTQHLLGFSMGDFCDYFEKGGYAKQGVELLSKTKSNIFPARKRIADRAKNFYLYCTNVFLAWLKKKSG